MTWLFKRGDAVAANNIRDALKTIIVAAFGGQATALYNHLQRLASDDEIDCNDPAFTFPMCRCTSVDGIKVEVMAFLRPDSLNGNRVMEFNVAIKATTWGLSGNLIAEAAQEANSWVFLHLPSGYCSHQNKAIQGLMGVSKGNLSFTACE